MNKIFWLVLVILGSSIALANPIDIKVISRANNYAIGKKQAIKTQGLHEYHIENNTNETREFFIIYKYCIDKVYDCLGGQKGISIQANDFYGDSFSSNVLFFLPLDNRHLAEGDYQITVATDVYQFTQNGERELLQSSIAHGNVHVT